jgi:hypothetical protein
MEGKAHLVDDDGQSQADITRLSKKYKGENADTSHFEKEDRVSFRFKIDRLLASTDLGGSEMKRPPRKVGESTPL